MFWILIFKCFFGASNGTFLLTQSIHDNLKYQILLGILEYNLLDKLISLKSYFFNYFYSHFWPDKHFSQKPGFCYVIKSKKKSYLAWKKLFELCMVVIETFKNSIEVVLKKEDVLSVQHFSLNCLINVTFKTLQSLCFLTCE